MIRAFQVPAMRSASLLPRFSVLVGYVLASLIGLVALTPGMIAHGEMPDFASPALELTSSQAATAEPIWYETLESGWAESKKSGRPMVIFITSEQCTYCDAMKRNTLCDPSVRKRLLGRFIPIRLRPDANNRVLSRVEVTAFPTTLVAESQGKVVAHRVGYQPVEKFHELLSEVAVAGATVPDVAGVIR
ncbi:thioredoxin family protein [Neorhodopirellula lusitana]|nr:thioredoxin fold domain-containing protein [Neorhodopirellula lusitana]